MRISTLRTAGSALTRELHGRARVARRPVIPAEAPSYVELARPWQSRSTMKWSWKLGRLFGIDVYMHATFMVLLGWVALSAYLRERSAHAMVAGVLFTSAIFGTVILHELGHALTARRFGIRTRDITLLPIGGLARLERMPERPGQELLVALAGPAVNVAIAGGLFAVLSATGQTILPAESTLIGAEPFLTRLFWVNVSLAIFNLIPAFPMDGGRALRALLAFGGDYVRATQVAAKLGQGIALLFGLLGLLFNPMLAFIALFVWIGAAGEAAGVEAKASLHGLPTYAAMETQFRMLSVLDTLANAAQCLLGGSQVDFPVLDGRGAVVGILTRDALLAGLAEAGPEATVESIMDRKFAVAHPAEMLDVSLARLEASGGRSMPVVADGRVLGMVTAENVGELLIIRGALRLPHPRAPLKLA
jgi:Zn-dependent protease/CBS domain-containing protein